MLIEKKQTKGKPNIKQMEKDLENIMTRLEENWQKFCKTHNIPFKDGEEMFDEIMTAGIVMEMFRKKSVGARVKGKR